MKTAYYREFSQNLHRDMEYKIYGHAGKPVLVGRHGHHRHGRRLHVHRVRAHRSRAARSEHRRSHAAGRLEKMS